MRRSARLLTAGAIAAMAATGCTVDRTPGPSGTEATSAAPSPATTTTPPAAREVLGDVELAATVGPQALRRAVRTELDPADRMGRDLTAWPVYVGTARVDPDGRVELDVVVSAPPDDDGELVLRWLAAAPALGDAVEDLQVEVDGAPVEPEVDRPGARVLVPVPAARASTVRVRAAYMVPPREELTDDGSPAGTGLLARSGDTLALGHWLPLVALASDDGPMQARGDVGAFPAGAFSVQVHHPGTLVASGTEEPCPEVDACTWVRGAGLRDVSAVLLQDAVTDRAGRAGTAAAVHAAAASEVAEDLEGVAGEALQGLDALATALGPLPWEEVDVVAVPLAPGALGMEFPGLVWVDPGAWPTPGPELGSYVLAHELGHQWFHALVGNGSLSAPVVDESLAQYLSVVVFDEVFGDGAGEELAASWLGGRHARALADGVPDEVPAQPLAAFSSDAAYGAAVYGRAGQAWVDAEDAAGRVPLLEALAALVDRNGLRTVDERGVLEVVGEVAPAALDPLRAGWGVAAS